MKQPIVVVGVSDLGSVLAGGFLQLRHPVYPVMHPTSMAATTTDALSHPGLASIANDERDELFAAKVEAFEDDPSREGMSSSAQTRPDRALAPVGQFEPDLPAFHKLRKALV